MSLARRASSGLFRQKERDQYFLLLVDAKKADNLFYLRPFLSSFFSSKSSLVNLKLALTSAIHCYCYLCGLIILVHSLLTFYVDYLRPFKGHASPLTQGLEHRNIEQPLKWWKKLKLWSESFSLSKLLWMLQKIDVIFWMTTTGNYNAVK